MEPPLAVIPARSERQAMDWSLVLVSQGIEAGIECDATTSAWQLTVHWPDYPRALEAIEQYRAENRLALWRHELPGTGLVFDWRGTAWFLLLTILFVMEQTRFGYLREAGLMDPAATRAGEWWRPLTATMLHADWLHLAHNVASGILLLGLAMGAFGPGLALLAAILAGAAGNLAGLAFHAEPHRSLGASGMVMGALGLLTAQSFWLVRAGLPGRQLMARGLLGGFLLLIWFGLSPDPKVDVLAHVAGFAAGVVFGGVLVLLPSSVGQNARINALAELLCGGLVVLVWWRALH